MLSLPTLIITERENVVFVSLLIIYDEVWRAFLPPSFFGCYVKAIAVLGCVTQPCTNSYGAPRCLTTRRAIAIPCKHGIEQEVDKTPARPSWANT